MNTKTLQSNGYGSFEQSIMIRVDHECAYNVTQALNVSIRTTHDEYVEFTWKRFTTKLRDDDDIVFEAEMLLSDIVCSCWSIDWEQSFY